MCAWARRCDRDGDLRAAEAVGQVGARNRLESNGGAALERQRLVVGGRSCQNSSRRQFSVAAGTICTTPLPSSLYAERDSMRVVHVASKHDMHQLTVLAAAGRVGGGPPPTRCQMGRP